MTRDRFRGHARVALVVVGALLLALTVEACKTTPSTPPPRSPFDDRGPAPTAPPGVTSYPAPFTPPFLTPTPASSATASPSPSATPTASPSGAAEAAAGAAIDALAGRMGVSATRLSLVSVEAVDWPDGCLGVSLPGTACAQAIMPGYRVRLRLDTGSLHEVHTGRGGGVAWLAQLSARLTVLSSESVGSTVTLTDTAGKVWSVLLTSGTQRLDVPVGSVKTGDRLLLGADDLKDGGPLRAAWIAPGG